MGDAATHRQDVLALRRRAGRGVPPEVRALAARLRGLLPWALAGATLLLGWGRATPRAGRVGGA